MTYQIGYKRPPKEGQFSKGKSGNPKGRPKGSKNFMTLLDKELDQSIVVSENGKKKTVTRLQAMVKRLVAEALQGEKKSLLVLFDILKRSDRLDGTETVDLVPNNYEAILEAYVQRRSQLAATTSSASTKSLEKIS
ncbi:DUF5681 domain-containing protein [Propionivibrio dicarboxylicus]|uniref:DUF5681 domain-containing protein n=1 Tax=Propionivibrio dicarboxylicus TaxID=83767 RepID=A0A1G7Z2Q0_9RHOO|nr:DUF5681 domain-containing protein [Propionivibrio dicarboxylicus]SDH02998.1 hypothetical protein SAMN05660652_01057 [Propionivibrio dicarboxylicus]